MIRAFDTPITTTDQSIDRVLAVDLPVLMVFLNGAPQESVKSAMERLAKEHSGKLLVVQLQVRDNPQAAARFNVTQAPAVAVIRNGKVESLANIVIGADLEKHAQFALGSRPKPESQAASGQAAGSGGKPVAVTDATFDQEVLKSDLPVLVDFWAEWCGPCHMIAPTVEKLARELPGKLKVVKVDVDANPQLTMRFGIRGIPTMMIFKGGQAVDQWTGAAPEGAIRSKVARWAA